MKKDYIYDLILELPKALKGEWIKKNSSYEHDLCKEIGWNKDTNRYFDATFKNHKIEIKKGKSIWLDLVRYSEIMLGIGENDTITTFFIPSENKEKIEKIIFVDTNIIIQKLNITQLYAEQILNLKNNVPRQLNTQASLTIKDVENISFYCHNF